MENEGTQAFYQLGVSSWLMLDMVKSAMPSIMLWAIAAERSKLGSSANALRLSPIDFAADVI